MSNASPAQGSLVDITPEEVSRAQSEGQSERLRPRGTRLRLTMLL